MINNYSNKKILLIIISLIAIYSILSLVNLGNRYLWYDEAHTALIGRNVLKYGIPKVWNGEYIVTTSNGNDFNDSFIIVKDGYLQYYLAALGELLSDFVHPRFVFVLIGIVGAIVFYLLAKQLTKDIKVSLIALFLYCTSIPIILYIRQVRYYSPAILFCLLTMLNYLLAVKTNRLKHWIAFSISSILLYHSLYFFFMIIMISLLFRYIFYDKMKINIKGLCISLFVIFVFTFPFFLYNQSFLSNLGDKRTSFQGLEYFLLQLPGYLWQVNTYYFPFIGMSFIFVFLYLVKKITNKSKNILNNDMLIIKVKEDNSSATTFLIVSIIVVNVIIASAFSTSFATRYLIPSMLIGYVALAILLSKLLLRDKLFGTIISTIIIFTNFSNISPYIIIKNMGINNQPYIEYVVKPPLPYFIAQGNYGFSHTLSSYLENQMQTVSYLKLYLLEISNDYDDVTEGVVKFLISNANKNDTVQADDFISDSIAYYTELKIVNRMTVITDPNSFWFTIYDKLPNTDKYTHLTYYPIDYVKWIVYLPTSLQDAEKYKNGIDITKYEVFEVLNYPNAPFAADIWEHSFITDYSYPNAIIIKNKSIQ